MSVELAELLGMMCGDGCLSKTQQGKHFVYCSGNRLKDKEYFGEYITNLFLKIFGKSIVAHEREDPKIIYIKFSDKQIFQFLNNLGLPVGLKYDKLKVPDIIFQDKAYQMAFVRGLFDTDGCVIFSKQHRGIPYYPRIEITSKSRKFLASVFAILISHGFNGSLSHQGKGYSRLEIPGFKNLKRWNTLIGSSNKRNQQRLLQTKAI